MSGNPLISSHNYIFDNSCGCFLLRSKSGLQYVYGKGGGIMGFNDLGFYMVCRLN
jgi:hypothetical protein